VTGGWPCRRCWLHCVAAPGATPVEIIDVWERQYLVAVSDTGAAVGGVAVAPGVGTDDLLPDGVPMSSITAVRPEGPGSITAR